MKKIILLFILPSLINCANKIDPIVSKAKRSCLNKYAKTALVPSSSTIFASMFSGSSSPGSSAVDTEVTITGSGSSSFTAPTHLKEINKTKTTLTGTISTNNEVHVFSFKGLTSYETWIIKFNSTTEVVCKAGGNLLTTITSIKDQSLSTILNTSAQNLTTSSSATTFIACTSPYNTDLTTPTPKTGTLSTPIDYSINLNMDPSSSTASSSASPMSSLTNITEMQNQIARQTAIFDLAKCFNDVERITDIKKFMLF